MENNKSHNQQKDLKQLAKEAKQRLITGYWDKVQNERRAKLTAAYERGLDIYAIDEDFSKNLQHELHCNQVSQYEKDEREFYKKVCVMLDTNEKVINPLAILTDKDYIKTLDEHAKQKYILELAEKYKVCREKYFREKSLKIAN